MEQGRAEQGEQAVEAPDSEIDEQGVASTEQDPFAADPLADVPALEAEAAPEVERDPFTDSAIARSKTRAKAKAKTEAKPKPKPEAKPKAAATADPFAADPLADVPALEAEAAPEVERDPFTDSAITRSRTRAEAKAKAAAAKAKAAAAKPKTKAKPAATADPFSEDPLADVAPLEAEAAPEVERDPFTDSAIARSRKRAEAKAKAKAKSKTPPTSAAADEVHEAPDEAETREQDRDEGADSPGEDASEGERATDEDVEDAEGADPDAPSTAEPPSDALQDRPRSDTARRRPPPAAWKADDDELLSPAKKDPPQVVVKAKSTEKAPSRPKSKRGPKDGKAPLEVEARPKSKRPKSKRPTGDDPKPILPAPAEQPPASDSSLAEPPPELLVQPSSPAKWIVFALVTLVLVAVAGWATQRHLDGSRAEDTLTAFLDRAAELEPQALLDDAEALAPELRSDERVEALVQDAKQALAKDAQRGRAEALVEQALAERDLGRALKLCNKAIVTFDGCAPAHALKARLAYLRAARSGEADYDETRRETLEGLEDALRIDPTCVLARWERARLSWANRNDPKVGEQVHEDLLAAAKQSTTGLVGAVALGYSLLLEGHLQRSVDQFEAALERDADSVDARIGRARALTALGEHLEAERTAGEAHTLDPQRAEPLAIRGHARWLRGETAKAREDLQAALALDPWLPGSWAVLSRLGASRDRDGKLDPGDVEARRKAAERALQLAPRQGLAHLTLGEIDESRGRTQDALEHYAAAVEAKLPEPGPRLARGLLRVRQGKWVEGEADLAAVLIIEPEHPLALAYAGAADVELKRWRSAGKRLTRVLQGSQPPAIAWRYAGLLALRAKPTNPARALECLSKALEFDEADAETRFHRAEAFLELDRAQEARADLERLEAGRAMGRIPAVARERLMGHALFALEDFSGAKRAYQAYLRDADPDDPHRALIRRRVERCRAHENGDSGPEDF